MIAYGAAQGWLLEIIYINESIVVLWVRACNVLVSMMFYINISLQYGIMNILECMVDRAFLFELFITIRHKLFLSQKNRIDGDTTTI